jgi:hypothetical protein
MHPTLGLIDDDAEPGAEQAETPLSGSKGYLLDDEAELGPSGQSGRRYCERCGGLDEHLDDCPTRRPVPAAKVTPPAERPNGQVSWRGLLGAALRAVARKLEAGDD